MYSNTLVPITFLDCKYLYAVHLTKDILFPTPGFKFYKYSIINNFFFKAKLIVKCI
jgi:hypothetical protein